MAFIENSLTDLTILNLPATPIADSIGTTNLFDTDRFTLTQSRQVNLSLSGSSTELQNGVYASAAIVDRSIDYPGKVYENLTMEDLIKNGTIKGVEQSPELIKFMDELSKPQKVPFLEFITPDGAELKEQEPYIFVPAPGTGIDAEYKPGPVEVGKVTAVILDYDPDPLIGGPGGVRYSELAKLDKPDSSRTYTPEELAELYRRGEIFYPLGFSAARPSAGNNLSSQFNSASIPESIVGTTSNVSSSIASPKLLNPPLLPSLSNASTSPLSTSRILPGFNQ